MAMSAVSDDRGLTWTPAQCVPDGWSFAPDSDGTSVSYISTTANALVQLDANGAVAATWPLPSAGELTSSSGVDGSAAYAWTPFGGGLVTLTATGERSCGVIPGIPNGTVSANALSAIGQQVVAVIDNGQYVAVSRDACASFATEAPPGATCDGVTLRADSVICQQEHGTLRLDLSSLAAGWTTTPIPDPGPLVGLARAGLELHELDTASTTWAPWTWPLPITTLKPAAATGSSPSGAIGRAMAFLNNRYRGRMGFADAVWQPQLALAARRHAFYWVYNGFGVGLQAHEEVVGKPGFTGKTPGARCAAAGAANNECGEVAYPDTPSPELAMAGWLGTPYHGMPLLTTVDLGLGTSLKGTVGDVSAGTADDRAGQVNTFDYDAPPNTPSSTEHVWPFDGATNVPVAWTGGEDPDPLAGYSGSHRRVGPVLFVSTEAPVRVQLKSSTGAVVPLIVPGSAKGGAVGSFTTTGGFVMDAVFASTQLRILGQYVLELSPELAGLPAREIHFTASSSATPPGEAEITGVHLTLPASVVHTTIPKCPEILTSTLRNSGTRVSYHFQAVGCTPQSLQIYRAGAWHVAPGKTFVIHAGKGERWRIIYRGRVLVAGHYNA
jgi:hypothetical protein